MKFTVGILVSSDRASRGIYEDKSGKLIKDIVEKDNYIVKEQIIVPDEFNIIRDELLKMSDNLKLDLILTSGGTGFSPRDYMPEVTETIIERKVPGISEAMRMYSLKITPNAMLSRGTAGIRKISLIINLPGSPKAVKENLEFILPTLEHGLLHLRGDSLH